MKNITRGANTIAIANVNTASPLTTLFVHKQDHFINWNEDHMICKSPLGDLISKWWREKVFTPFEKKKRKKNEWKVIG